MTSLLNCCKHQNKPATYICSYPQCSESLLCHICVPLHASQHLPRLLTLTDTFDEEGSFLNIVKRKQQKEISKISSLLKNKDLALEKSISEIEICFERLTEDFLKITQEAKKDLISELRKEISNEIGYDTEKLETFFKNMAEIKLVDENNMISTVTKLQKLEDELIPACENVLKNLIPRNLDEYFQSFQKSLLDFQQEFRKQLKIVLPNFKGLSKVKYPLDKLRINVPLIDPLKNLEVTKKLKLEADIFHQFNNLIISDDGVLTVDPWNGQKGGRLLIICKSLIISSKGMIDVSGCGYRGGFPCLIGAIGNSYSGESYIGKGVESCEPNGGGGGGGQQIGEFGSIGGGGGGYGAPGNNSEPNIFQNGNRPGGKGGLTYGDQDINVIYMGSGGGAGSPYTTGGEKCKGGNGGGVVFILAKKLIVEGKILANGSNGEDASLNSYGSGGGGGSGGSIVVYAPSVQNKGEISIIGGKGGESGNKLGSPLTSTKGGEGGIGRFKAIQDLTIVNKLNIHGLNFN